MITEMKNNLLKKTVSVLMCLVMFGNLAHGMVLCIGESGHVSLEFKADDCCGEILEIAVPACEESGCQEAHFEESDPCGDCVDIPLSGNCEAKRPTSYVIKKVVDVRQMPAAVFSIPVYNVENTGVGHFDMTYPPGDIVASISSVVLTL